jgi:hypothetical protein
MLKTPPKHKVKQPVEKPVDLPDFLKHYTGPVGDEGISFSDRAFWIDRTKLRIDEDWLNAFKALDEKGDKKPLTALLRSGRELVPAVRDFLANLIERRMKPVPKHRAPNAVYDRSPAEARRLLAIESVRAYIKEGYGEQDALDKAALEYEIPVNTLADDYANRYAPLRRIRKRRPRGARG